jgi:hypothetical protein
MSQQQEHVTLETDHLEEVIESAPPGQPVVVIQYRSRGLPWYAVLPLLVLVPLAAVAAYHRVTSRFRPQEVPGRSPQRLASALTKPGAAVAVTDAQSSENVGTAASSKSATPPSEPLALNSQPLAPGSLAASPAAATNPKASVPAVVAAVQGGSPAAPTPPSGIPKPVSSPGDRPPPPPVPASQDANSLPTAEQPGTLAGPASPKPKRIGFAGLLDDANPFADLQIARTQPAVPRSADPEASPAAASALPSEQKPTPTREEMLQSLKAEAAEKKAELKQLRNLKDHARDTIAAEAMERTEDERLVFRRELSVLLKTGGKKTGAQIDELCDKFGRNYDPELRARLTQVLARSAGRMGRDAKVRLLRLYGVPEAGILDFLANDLHRYINTRNGPRDPNEVRVNAAKQLLSIKLASGSGGTAKAAVGRPGQPGEPNQPETAPLPEPTP